MRLSLRVVPNARAAGVVGWMEEGSLKVKVTAPPEDGRANKAVCALLAEVLGCPLRALSIVAGQSARNKVVQVDGLDEAAVRAKLEKT